MARPNILQKRTANRILENLAAEAWVSSLPSESQMARRMNLSRTTVRGACQLLVSNGVLTRSRGMLVPARRPRKSDYFSEIETSGPRELIERTFVQRILLGDWQPGQLLSETDLARESGAGLASVREFLIGFSRFHLVEKRPRGGWRLLGLDVGLANEVAEMRALVETAAIERVPDNPDFAWMEQLDALIQRHEALMEACKQNYLSFASLDRDFHLWLIAHLRNRFARDLYDVISFVFHYHYQWNKASELERNRVAIAEHLRILAALRAGDRSAARARLAEHLATSRASFIRSVRDVGNDPSRGRRRIRPADREPR